MRSNTFFRETLCVYHVSSAPVFPRCCVASFALAPLGIKKKGKKKQVGTVSVLLGLCNIQPANWSQFVSDFLSSLNYRLGSYLENGE